VLAPVPRHVDQRGGLSDRAEGGFLDRLGSADERDDRAVRGGAGIDVQEHRARTGRDLGGDRVDDGAVASFAEIGDAFDELHGGGL
jgi:hypothetical protein